MNLSLCLITYILLFLVLFLILTKNGKDAFSSFVICVGVCLVYLILIFPPHQLKIENENYSYSMLYTFILVVSIIICVAYSITVASSTKSLSDKKLSSKNVTV